MLASVAGQVGAQDAPTIEILTVPAGSGAALNPFHCLVGPRSFQLDDETELIVSAQRVAGDVRVLLYARRDGEVRLEPVWNGSVATTYETMGGLLRLGVRDFNADGQDELVIANLRWHGAEHWLLSQSEDGRWRTILSATGFTVLGVESRVGLVQEGGVTSVWGRDASGEETCWHWRDGASIDGATRTPGRCGHGAGQGDLIGRPLGTVFLASPSGWEEALARLASRLADAGASAICDG
ncbi:hypothetical protein Mmar10_2058 [Maricaulis maris MCS10]|uniref:FG-GAP repeat protein n=2 Tax=Maricaulis maris TaxID=74318 RepID=Q0AMY7_MARMM|nr:hypothetical protein Mmar10_2058 [Maricaulis maris MCS10]